MTLLVTVETPGDFDALSDEIVRLTARPMNANIDTLENFVAAAAERFFSADATGNVDQLRGFFSDAVIARLQAQPAGFGQVSPTEVSLRLGTVLPEVAPPTLRIHLAFKTNPTPADQTVLSWFWDLNFDANVVVAAGVCKSCGATLSSGALTCRYCGADQEVTKGVPIVVVRAQYF